MESPSGDLCRVTFESVMGVGAIATEFLPASIGNCSTTDAGSMAAAAQQAGMAVNQGHFYGPLQDVNMTMHVPNSDLVITAKLNILLKSGERDALIVKGANFPTFGNSQRGAFLGNSIGGQGFYQGATGYPAIYTQKETGQSALTVALRDVQVTNGAGDPLKSYSIVSADAESTDSFEYVSWETNGVGLRWLPNNPVGYATATTASARKEAAVGNDCQATPITAFPADITKMNVRSVECGATVDSVKTGTAML